MALICTYCCRAADLFSEKMKLSSDAAAEALNREIEANLNTCPGGTWCDNQKQPMKGLDPEFNVAAEVDRALFVHAVLEDNYSGERPVCALV